MRNYLEQQYLSQNLFIDEQYLDVNHMMNNILHREQELLMLSKIFINLIETPFKISRKLLIQGPIGIGKTLITQIFREMLLQSAKDRNLNIDCIQINCRKLKSSYNILVTILKELGENVPIRGYSSQELISILENSLIKKKKYVLLILDELNYLNNSNFDLFYSLSRLNDVNNKYCYLSIISIVKDFTLLKTLDQSTISTLQENVLMLKKYSKKQLFDILKQRVKFALKPGVISDSLIMHIVNNCVESGDVRKAINITRNSIKIAESKMKLKVSIEEVHDAIKNLIPSFCNDILNILNLQQLLLFNAIVLSNVEDDNSFSSFSLVKEKYYYLCKKYNKIPRKNTQLWEYLKELEHFKLINKKVKSINQKGRSSSYSVNEIPLELLKYNIKQKLKDFGDTKL